MKVILIDAEDREFGTTGPKVREVEVANELEPIQKLVGGYIEAHRLTNGDLLLLNEDFFTITRKVSLLWAFNYGRWGGQGVIVGVRGSEWTSPKTSVKAVEKGVQWAS